MLVNHPPVGTVEALKNAVNEEIIVFGDIVYSDTLGLHRHAVALAERNIEVPKNLQRLQRNFHHTLQEFGVSETCLRHSFPKLKFSKDLLALFGYLNSKILPLYLDTELCTLQVQTLIYCAAVAVVRTFGKKRCTLDMCWKNSQGCKYLLTIDSIAVL